MGNHRYERSRPPGYFTAERREEFLEILRTAGSIAAACRQMEINQSTPYYWRRNDPAFAAKVLKALGKPAQPSTLRRVACAEGSRPAAARRSYRAVTDERLDTFLLYLVMTSNVVASADAARIHASCLYRRRDKDPAFRQRWMVALSEGYGELEMEMLGRARFGIDRPVIYLGKVRDTYTDYTDATALKFLTLHKDAVMRFRAEQRGVDEEALIEEIDARLAEMKRRMEQEDDEAAG